MNFELKEYQRAALDILEEFFDAAPCEGAAAAYSKIASRKDEDGNPSNRYASQYKPAPGAEDCPHVCVRVPTAGGKTFMAARSLRLLHNYRADYLERIGETKMRAPVVLWFVPSESIFQQTVAMLSNRAHPCGGAVREAFGDSVRVCSINDFDILQAQDFSDGGVIVVSTAQMFRIGKTTRAHPDGMNKATRRIYAPREDFASHFARFTPDPPPDGLERDANGRVKKSFANLLHLARPAVVCDEAHNFTSEKSREVLRRINPACILEWTATPRMSENGGVAKTIKHNVIASVSANELQKAEMVKLPIRVGEHEDWERAVQAAVAERARLAKIAADFGESIRPLALYRASDKTGETPPEKLKTHLRNAHGIGADEIAIVTADIKGLDGADLLAEDCKINHIITIAALREGWDCSYAYVLCAAANIAGETAAEQLLGRVMRMPFAKRRAHPDLNRAYAHFPAAYSTAAVEALRNNLAAEHGYDEAEFIVQPPMVLFLENAEDGGDFSATVRTETAPDFSALPPDAEESLRGVEVKPAADGKCEVVVRSPVPDVVREAIVAAVAKSERPAELRRLQNANARMSAARAPAVRGKIFAPLPELYFYSPAESEEVKADSESLYQIVEWNDIGDDCVLSDFRIEEKGEIYEIVAQSGKVRYSRRGEYRGSEVLPPEADAAERARLASWLERETRAPDGRYFPETLKKFVGGNLARLEADGCEIAPLVRAKRRLARALKQTLESRAQKIARRAAKQFLFDNPKLKSAPTFAFPARCEWEGKPYSGAYVFQKHYYPVVYDLDGGGEEYECAKALDMADEIKFWIRNPSRPGAYSIPYSINRSFYPDFIAELRDGKILVVEYKGDHLKKYDALKECMGEKMEELSGGRHFFAMITAKGAKQPEKYASIAAQIRAKIADAMKARE